MSGESPRSVNTRHRRRCAPLPLIVRVWRKLTVCIPGTVAHTIRAKRQAELALRTAGWSQRRARAAVEKRFFVP